MTLTFAIIASFLAGLFVGLGVWLRLRSGVQEEREALKIQVATLEKESEATAEKVAWTELAEKKMREAFTTLSSEALRANSQTLQEQAKGNLKSVIDPLKENLGALDQHVRDLESARKGAYEGLKQHLTNLGETHRRLQETTTSLTQALKAPTVRGKWGEIQLRRVVEMAGMVKHVDFDEQTSTEGGRPDAIVYLPNEGVLPLDSKVPLSSYLAAMETTDEDARKEHLAQHAKAVRDRARELGQKEYWNQFEKSPDFVVMFVPNEAILGAAYEVDPDLLDFAIKNKVLISSPVNLLALLKAVAYGWQQHQVTDNAIRIAEEGKQLYGRIQKFIEHFADVGKYLNRSVDGYNQAVGSLDRRLIPAARRFEELGISETELSAPRELDIRSIPPMPTGEADSSPTDEQTDDSRP